MLRGAYVLELDFVPYQEAWDLQRSLAGAVSQGAIPDTVVFLEHPPVVTLGRRADAGELHVPEGAEVGVVETDRGGKSTFHGPGQLVAYPIFDLRSFSPKLGAVDFVRRLEDVLMRICAHYQIETQRVAGMTGVWTMPHEPLRVARERRGGTNRDYSPEVETEAPKVPERKIAAIGVHISRGVTSHGFALNVTTDLEQFKLIVPCGLTKPVTSIEFETGERPALEDVANLASRSFSEVFQSQMLWFDSIHDLIPEAGDPINPQDTPAVEPAELRAIRGDGDRLA